ncbi:DEAD/DEAH box helicase [Jiulongibacter sediminis]|uniref:RNA helicase n=1 Tax=Jiulongibacter sediminis TaxID=1605367 RepID=A0A0P7BD59_9BACT|nr:DEAD/DEAH box helicase [Jiulongibacter sediminis]KPM48613.1 RNA helicase [Jiulongibacter sediminis]TBX25151.1 RNA helicase [Jiulongibacter sediminis]
MTFKELQLDEKLLEGLDAIGFENATPVQELAVPKILQNKDLIACAQTGTGKTAAFLLPVLHKIVNMPEKDRHLNTLIIAPTRELAIQIDQQVEGLSYFTGVSSIPVYGGGDGEAFITQKRALEAGADIVIATPGRLIALMNSKTVDFGKLQHLILDEADRMLDMGFLGDIMRIISNLPENRQTLLFSATMAPEIRKLAAKILKEPEQINIAISKPAKGIDQQAYVVYDTQKLPLLVSIVKDENFKSIIVFSSSKDNVKNIERELNNHKCGAKGFSSDLDQSAREALMNQFKAGKVRVLVGTDVISRGIDVTGIDLVVNFDCPPDPEDYIHRIGRTARAGSAGTAITLINQKDQRKFYRIESLIGEDIPKKDIPEEFGKGPEYTPQKKGGGLKGDSKKNFKGKSNRNFKGKRPFRGKRKGAGPKGSSKSENRPPKSD